MKLKTLILLIIIATITMTFLYWSGSIIVNRYFDTSQSDIIPRGEITKEANLLEEKVLPLDNPDSVALIEIEDCDDVTYFCHNSICTPAQDCVSFTEIEMLKYVVMCESSNRHEGIWGKQGEYGILQFKEETFNWLSEKYNFKGEWKNKDDQLALFLLTSEEEKYQHWSCFRKYLKYEKNILN